MPRILLLATTDLVHDQRMTRISSSLHRAGAQVLLVGRILPHSQPLSTQQYEQQRMRCHFHKGKWFYLEFNIRLFFFLLSNRFDQVCAADLDTLLPALLVARLRGKKVLYDAHEYFTEVPELLHRPATRRVWEIIARIGIPRVDTAYTVGQHLAEVLSQRYGRPFHVIRNMPAGEPSVPAPDNHRPLLLYQGALNAGRGLEALLEAMLQLPDYTLWIAGQGDLQETLMAFSATHRLEKNVHFLGNLPPDTLRTITPRAWLGLNLLDGHSLSYYYSLANKSMDYVQAGIPSLQMDFPEYRHLNQTYPCFILLADASPASILNAVRGLEADPARYAQLCRNCREAQRVWNWEQEEKKLLPLYFPTPIIGL